MNTPKFRLAAVGTGYFSQFHYDAWHRLSVNLTGICSLKIEEAKTVSSNFENCDAFTNFEEMLALKKPNLVDVIVPPKAQVLIIKHCLEHRVPVICQKPYTIMTDLLYASIGSAPTEKIKILRKINIKSSKNCCHIANCR